MIKRFFTILFVAIVCLNSFALAQVASKSGNSTITKAEEQEASDLAKRFTARFLETKDLAPLLDEFYFRDFIDRYKKFQSKEGNKSGDSLFVSGLTYDSKVLAEGNSEDWRRFYVSAHNFVLLLVIAALKYRKANPTKDDFDVVKFFPPSVVALVDKNPNLANMIQKKGMYKPIGSVEEMRSATATLEQASTIIREKQGSSIVLNVDNNQLTKIFKSDDFKPELELADDNAYGFPKGTRFILIKTPIAVGLILAKDGDDKLKIVYATLDYGD